MAAARGEPLLEGDVIGFEATAAAHRMILPAAERRGHGGSGLGLAPKPIATGFRKQDRRAAGEG